MSNSDVVIATYNMSFMNDLGTDQQWASEATFLNSNKSSDRRLYWKNALNLLSNFILDHKPLAVGLQELNCSSDSSDTGTGAIKTRLSELNKELSANYVLHTMGIIVNDSVKTSLGIILDETRGGKKHCMTIIDNPLQNGRPLLVLMTDSGNLFCCIHGAQIPSNGKNKEKFNNDMLVMNKMFLEDVINMYVLKYIKQIKNVFAMGDFNDRYDAINQINLIGKSLSYMGKSPYACCHNWDSSCSASRYRPFNDKHGYCDTDGLPITPANKREKDMESEGYIENYRYKGDKVFGYIPTSKLEIYGRSNKKIQSTESDHELVFGSFRLNQSGGKRSKSKRKSGRKFRKY